MPLELTFATRMPSRSSSDALREELATLGTLSDVVRWGLSQTPPALVERVLCQDEFTRDVIVKRDDDLYLVFDAT